MAFYQSSPSIELIYFMTILESYSMEYNAKEEQKSSGIYLLGCFLAQAGIFMTGF